jgi:hypothetical protein
VKKPNYWKHDDAIHKLDPKGEENLKVTWRYRLETKAEYVEGERY